MAESADDAWDPAAAEVRRSLGRALALGEGFALHLVTTTSRADVDRVVAWTEAQGRSLGSVREQVRIDPYADATLDDPPLAETAVDHVLERLEAPHSSPADRVLWLDLSRAPGPPAATKTESGRDDAVLRRLFRALNERRNDLVRGLQAPLVLLAPARLMRAFAEEAPDFWSIRSLNLRMPASMPVSVHPAPELAVASGTTVREALGPAEAARLEHEIAELRARLQRAPQEPTHRVALAHSLIEQAADLGAKGEHAQARVAGEEALVLSRALAQANDHYLPYVASALRGLGKTLSELGDREGALEATREAVELWRDLVAHHGDAFLPDLAGSLNSLGNRLCALGDREGALAATLEAVELYRQLVAHHPDAFLPSLATALNNLGHRLGELGEQRALAATREAVEVYRGLAADGRVAFLPDLSTALDNLGARLGALGDPDGALAATREAAELRRELDAAGALASGRSS